MGDLNSDVKGKLEENSKVLVVDDEDDMRSLLVTMMESEGFSTVETDNGEEALEKQKEHSPELVLLDIKLPGMNGMEVLKGLKDYDRRVKVIMITAYGGVQGAVKALKRGAFDYILKPFDNEKLIFKSKKAIYTRRLEEKMKKLRKKIRNLEND